MKEEIEDCFDYSSVVEIVGTDVDNTTTQLPCTFQCHLFHHIHPNFHTNKNQNQNMERIFIQINKKKK
jgi:hypothetical protein